MANELDPRLITVGIEVNGVLKVYSDPLMLAAEGTKFANANQNECTVKLANLEKATQDYILTMTSPYNLNKTPKRIIVSAGRVSYGVTQIYSGNIVSSIISQPPDVVITLKCLTGNFQKGNIVATSQAGTANLSQISEGVANSLGVRLNFQANDKPIANYNFSGGALKQVDKLNQTGLINAFVDDDTLIVQNVNVPLTGPIRVVDLDNGMIETPEMTAQGIKVKYFLDNISRVGGGLQVKSQRYPAANGTYVIYKLGFEIANRAEPFYYTAEASRLYV